MDDSKTLDSACEAYWLYHWSRRSEKQKNGVRAAMARALTASGLAALEDENKTLRDIAEGAKIELDAWVSWANSHGGGGHYPSTFAMIETIDAALAKPAALSVMCYCERWHNGLGRTGRGCECKPAALPAEGKGESEAVATVHVYESAMCNGRKLARVEGLDSFAKRLPVGQYPLLATPPAPQPLDGAVKVKELVEEYADACKRNAIEMHTMPISVIREHFQEFAEKLSSLSPAPQPLEGAVKVDEVICAECGRAVALYPRPATGWLAKCGKRLTRLDECSTGCDAPAPQPVGEVRDGLPVDLFTHKDAWRNALVAMRDTSEVSEPDLDDASYWQHELDAFDRVYAMLSASPAAQEDGE